MTPVTPSPEIVCLCGDVFRTTDDMANHLWMAHDHPQPDNERRILVAAEVGFAMHAVEDVLPHRWTLRLESNGRGTYHATALPPFLPYEEWWAEHREAFGSTPDAALGELARMLQNRAAAIDAVEALWCAECGHPQSQHGLASNASSGCWNEACNPKVKGKVVSRCHRGRPFPDPVKEA